MNGVNPKIFIKTSIIGISYAIFTKTNTHEELYLNEHPEHSHKRDPNKNKKIITQVFSVVIITTAIGGLVFQSTTFAMPKILAENLGAIAHSSSAVGGWTFLVLALSGFAQLVIGHFLDRSRVPILFAVVTFGQAVFFTLMVFVTGYLSLIVALFFMLLVFGQIPINDVMIGRVVSSKWRSCAIAIRSTVTFTVMATTIPFIAWIQGSWGFDRLFVALALFSSTSFIAAVTLKGISELDIRQTKTAKT